MSSGQLVVDYPRTDNQLAGFRLGLRAPLGDDPIGRAAEAAAGADVAVVVVGTDEEWETEGHDRHTMALPGQQDELVRRVAAANPRTVVAVNAGAAGRPAVGRRRSCAGGGMVPWHGRRGGPGPGPGR